MNHRTNQRIFGNEVHDSVAVVWDAVPNKIETSFGIMIHIKLLPITFQYGQILAMLSYIFFILTVLISIIGISCHTCQRCY